MGGESSTVSDVYVRYLVGDEVNDEICNLAASLLDVGNEGARAEPRLDIAADEDESQGAADHYAP